MLSAVGKRHVGRDDAGLTLAELVVAMTITMILMTVATVFFVNAERAGYKSVLTNQTTADARTALDSWTSMLRVAGWLPTSTNTDRFEEITPTKIVFYANLNNRNTADLANTPLTKVALMLRPAPGSSEGQLMEVTFKPDNTTPQSVRQVAFNAAATGGAGNAIFQPYNVVGGPVDVVNTYGCLSGATPQTGLCLQAPPYPSAGMLDPTLAPGSNVPTQGLLRGNPAQNVDAILKTIAGVTIAFTVSDPTHTARQDFIGAASVNSGFPS